MTQSNSIDRDQVPSVQSEPGEVLCFPGGTVIDDGDNQSSLAALNPRQRQALEWLTSGGTIAEAAELIGVQRQTVSRWVNHHVEFSRLYSQWQEQIRSSTEARIMGLADAAVDNIIAAVRECHDVKASQFVLKLLGIASRKRG